VSRDDTELTLSSSFEGMAGDLEDLYASSIPCILLPRRKLWGNRRGVPDFLESKAIPGREGMVTLLAHHFPASAALATVPGVTRLTVECGEYQVDIANSQGVCVWDVVAGLARK